MNENYGSDECSSIESIDSINENICTLCEKNKYHNYKSIFQICNDCNEMIFTPYTNNYAFYSLLTNIKNYYYSLENDHYLSLINYFTSTQSYIFCNENSFEL